MAVLEYAKDTSAGLQERLIRRAWEDEQFAELLRTKPRQAIAEATGVELPANLDIQVHHEDEQTLHVVVPKRPRGAVTEATVCTDRTTMDTSERFCGTVWGFCP